MGVSRREGEALSVPRRGGVIEDVKKELGGPPTMVRLTKKSNTQSSQRPKDLKQPAGGKPPEGSTLNHKGTGNQRLA